ncbi:MAG: hypothetical protein R3A50_09915 [Saprospiraceae bacterium]
MNAYEHIEDYLNNELSENDRLAFEKSLQDDPNLQEALENHRKLIGHLQSLRRREFIKKNMVETGSESLKAGAFNRRLLATAAAIALVGTVAYVWVTNTQQTPQPNLAEQPALPLDTPAITNESQFVQESPKADPEKTVKPPTNEIIPEKQTVNPKIRMAYAEAVTNLEKSDYAVMGENSKDSSLETKLNTAVRYLKADEPSGAIPLLEDVLLTGNPLYQDDAEWLLALAILPQNTERSRQALQAISRNPSHAYRIKAIKLIKQLE